MPVKAVDLPFREQAEFFRRKLNVPTAAWTDIYAQEHNWAFVVAGANRDAIVSDFRAAVDKVIAEGVTVQEFRKDFDRIVESHGWSYNGGRNWRSRVIYDTNLNSSYMAGRYEQLLAVREERPYWQYLHSDAVENPRPIHLGWNGMILRWDDPWWQYHFPTNGWGCQCRVIALSDADLQRMGKSGPDTAPLIEWEERIIGQRSPGGPFTVQVPKGVDPGFEYTPGRGRLESSVPPPTSPPGGGVPPDVPGTRAPDPLLPPRPVPAERILPDSISPRDAVRRFLAEFDATPEQPAIFTDVVGERHVIGEGMFTLRDSGELVAPPSRHMLQFTDALKTPDEVWTQVIWLQALEKAKVVRRYIATFIASGETVRAVVEMSTDGWQSIIAATDTELDAWRTGVRLYTRTDE